VTTKIRMQGWPFFCFFSFFFFFFFLFLFLFLSSSFSSLLLRGRPLAVAIRFLSALPIVTITTVYQRLPAPSTTSF
jgi:hypothetical protein